jgi:hypothetical protein
MAFVGRNRNPRPIFRRAKNKKKERLAGAPRRKPMKKQNANQQLPLPFNPVNSDRGFGQVIRQLAASKSQSQQDPVNRPLHGPNGIGKTTSASTFPRPLFIAEEETTPPVLPPAPIKTPKPNADQLPEEGANP